MDSVNLTHLAGVISKISDHILDYALLLAAIGTITMALIELLKGVTTARMFFHRYMVKTWIQKYTSNAKTAAATLNELLNLAAGGKNNANVLYDQPTGKMLGQIQAASNVALDFPSHYPAFYRLLAMVPGDAGSKADCDTWQGFCDSQLGAQARKPSKTDEAEARDASQARARLGNLVARKLDALQTKIEYWWARLNQLLAVAGGAGFLAYVLYQQSQDITINLVVLSLFGGLVAPFAKDVVTALSGLRARRA